MVRPPDDTDSSASRSARGTPTRPTLDLPRSQAASKGGCWTCRLRRKKCDEQRVGESCQTCVRLRIKCLGWGTRRPDWMRNKQSVEEYKASIKAQLTRAGMIRGQPRSTLGHSGQSVHRNNARPYPMPRASQPTRRPSAATRHDAPASSSSSNTANNTNTTDFLFQFIDTTPLNDVSSAVAIPHMMTSPGSHDLRLPMTSYGEPSHSLVDYPTSPFSYSPPQSMSPLSASQTPSEAYHDPFSPLPTDYDISLQNPSPVSNQNSAHVMYYFANVCKMQYAFATSTVTNIIYSMIAHEPQGPVINAVCALANLHYTRAHAAQGFHLPETNHEAYTAQSFYDQAYFQISERKRRHGHYSESDAVAALHLVSYSMCSGGVADWQSVLAIACEWLAETGIHNDDEPELVLLNMSLASRFAVKMTMWMDIMASLSLRRPPRHLPLYKRLLAGNNGFWQGHHDNNFDLRLESLSGCPDEALLAIAEVSSLAYWKYEEKMKGSLSVRALIRRGDSIEQQLRRHTDPQAGFLDIHRLPLQPPKLLPIPITPVSTESSSAQGENVLGCQTPTGSLSDDELRQVVADIFREAAALYLHTVLSDWHPAVPEIRSCVDAISNLVGQLSISELDRSLVFPICLAGCLTDDLAQRSLLRTRLQTCDAGFGTLMQARVLMDAVWQRRDMHGGAVDWRDLMHEQGLNLLLI